MKSMVSRGRPEDFEVCSTGTRLALTEKDIRIEELEAENRSLKSKLASATLALQFTDEDLAKFRETIIEMGEILKGKSA